jgi:hypothetical protein
MEIETLNLSMDVDIVSEKESEEEESLLNITLAVPDNSSNHKSRMSQCQPRKDALTKRSMGCNDLLPSKESYICDPFLMELKGFLSMLVASANCEEGVHSSRSEDNIDTQQSHRTLFRQSFQERCGLINSRKDMADEEAEAQKEALRKQFNLDHSDLYLIFDHIFAAKTPSNIRWDLIESVIFPEIPP